MNGCMLCGFCEKIESTPNMGIHRTAFFFVTAEIPFKSRSPGLLSIYLEVCFKSLLHASLKHA